jgi:NADH-quinone oxidoreductase subunit N
MFYLAAYYFMNLGAFGFLLYFEGVTGSDTYESLKGLGWKAPLVSVAMVVFLVSLTGLPPTVGFYGKYLLFQEAIGGGFAWLAVVAGINSVISLFYYMRVAKMLFLAAPAEENPAPQVAFTGLVAGLGALTVLFGIYTSPIQDWVRASFGG